jgi:hypothetical protein
MRAFSYDHCPRAVFRVHARLVSVRRPDLTPPCSSGGHGTKGVALEVSFKMKELKHEVFGAWVQS